MPKPKPSPSIKDTSQLLYQYDGQNPFSGEFSNAIYTRRAKRKFTVWVKSWSSEGTSEDCWHKDIDAAADFVSACQTCLDFVEFGEAGVVDVIRGNFQGLKKIDLSFAEGLRAELLEQFSEDCAMARANPPDIVDARVKVERLSSGDAQQKYGSAIMFIPWKSTNKNAT